MVGGDPGAAASFFSAAAQFLTPDGTEVSGRPAIAQLLGQLTSSDQLLEIRTGRTVLGAGVALCTQYWVRRSRHDRGERFEAASTARLVLAQEELRWQIVIAAPWG
jgi:ketosteroid isomerase-like protein